MSDTKNEKRVVSENEKYSVKWLTCQPGLIKTLFEALNGILTDVNINFTKEMTYIYMMNSVQTVFVDLKLYADKFDEYYFNPENKNNITTGIRMDILNKKIKSLNNNCVLSLFHLKQMPKELGIMDEINDRGSRTISYLKTIDLDLQDLKDGIKDNQYKTIISIDSSYFCKLIRDAHGFVSNIDLKVYEDTLMLTYEGDSIKTVIEVKESKETMSFLLNEEPSNIKQGKYSLKILSSFTKCTGISKHVRLYISNDLPMHLEYKVGNLGRVKLFSCSKEV